MKDHTATQREVRQPKLSPSVTNARMLRRRRLEEQHLLAVRRISGTIVVVMVLHALWDFGSFSHVAGKAGAVAVQTDIVTAGAGLLQSLLVLIAVILVIVGAKKILRPGATAQASALQA